MTESARLVVTVDSTQVTKAATDLSTMERSAKGAEQAAQKLTNSAASAADATKSLGSSAASAASSTERIESAAAGAAKGMDSLASAASKVGSSSSSLDSVSRNLDSAASASSRLTSGTADLGDAMARAQAGAGAASKALDVMGGSSESAASAAVRAGSAANDAAAGITDLAGALARAGSSSDNLDLVGRSASSARSAVDQLSRASQSLGGEMDKVESAASTAARAVNSLDVIQDVDDHIGDFNDSIKDTKDNADEAADAFGKFRDSANDVQDVTPPTGSAVDNLGEALKRLVIQVTAFISVVEGIKKLSDVQRQFDVLNAGLVTATTSAEKAAGAFDALQQFAAKTPYDLNQAVDGFTKLVNLGLTPSEKAMVSYGNTASAMGKDLNQMIEAVADATTGEFERLKEFGIKAKQDGDKVTMVFQGVKTTIGNNAKEIEKYLIALGENQFAGAMARRVDTLDGKIAALGDTWDTTFRLINNAATGAIMKDSVQAANDALEELNSQLASGQLETNLGAMGGKFRGWAEDVKVSFGIVSDALTLESGFWSELVSNNVNNMVSTFRDFPENVRALIQLMTVEIAAGLDKAYVYAVGFARKAKAALSFGNNDAAYEAAGQQLEADLAAVNQARESSIETIMTERNAAVESFAAQRNMATMQRDMYESGQALAARSTEDRLAGFKKVSEAEKELTDEQKKAAKDAAALAERQKKALEDLVAQSAISVKSTNAMADAYLAGADNVRALTIQQKIEEELLKTGADARTKVAKAINDEADARDRLAVGELVAQMRTENTQTLDLAKATLQGESAIEAYNVAKQVQTALIGKNIAVGSKEHEQLLDVTKAQLANNKALDQANRARGLVDRLNPEIAALREYREAQESLTWAMENDRENIDLYQKTLVKLGNEYEVNRSKATIWGQMTEAAVDRIDGVFADAWANIGDGAESLWDNLKKGFKQTLGEIMHMLTTKPLLASISNWLTGTDNGQGLSSVWGKLLGSATGSGGGGSSSGGGLWSGALGLGKNLVSAWNTLTGVGSAASAGFASGGVSGAISGITGYYGSIFSTAVSTFSGGLSSLATALGLNSVATTAAATTVEGAFSAGLAQMGTQMIASSGTTTVGTIGAGAAAQAGVGAAQGGLSAALSSAAAMWPLAVIMGMYQSGKLYDAGVRPDAGAMMDSGGSTALGKATMAPLAIQSKIMELTDKINGSIVGGKVAAIISGSTVHQAVWNAVGKKLFGTGYQTKDSGISLGVEDGKFDAQSFVKQKKKGGLISGSSKTRFLYNDLDAELADPLGQAYNERIIGSLGLFSTLGVKLADTVLDNFNVAAAHISTQGRAEEDIKKDIDAWFASMSDVAVAAINEATNAGLGGYTYEGLTTFVNNLYGVNNALKHINVGLFDMSVTGGYQAEQLSAWAGGFDKLQESIASYYGMAFTETEKAANVMTDVRDAFKASNLVLPESRDGFRALVEGIDKSTEAGRQMFLTLMSLAPAAAAAFDVIESRQAAFVSTFYTAAEQSAVSVSAARAEFEKLGLAVPATRAEFRALVDGLSTTTEASKAIKEQLLALAPAADTIYALADSLAAVAEEAEKTSAATKLANQQTYYDQFSTEAQRSRDTLAGVAKQFAALNIEMPGTRNAFIQMAEGVDRTTESGRKLYDTIMSLAGPADTAFDLIEKQLNAGVTDAFSALQRSVNAEKTALGDAYNARTASLNDMLSTASSSGSELSAIAGALESALKSLRGTSDDAVRMLRVQAQATLQTALATARSGGSLAGVVGLQDALDVASSMDEGLYSSLEEFEREQGRTANVIAELNVLNEGQLSTSETISLNIKKQLEQDKKAYDTEIAKLDETLLYWQTNIDALAGINNSVIGVQSAIGNMSSAFSSLSRYLSDAAAGATPNGNVPGVTGPIAPTPIPPGVTQPGTTVPPLTSAYTGMAASVDLVFQALLGRTADKASVDYWLGMITAGKVAPDGLIDAIRKDAIGNGEVPKFATGGLISGPGTGTSDSIMARVSAGEYVMRAAAVSALGTDLLDQLNTGRLPAFADGGGIGETGPVLQITRPSQIYSRPQQQADSGRDAQAAEETRQLRSEVKGALQSFWFVIDRMASDIRVMKDGGVQVVGTVTTKAEA